MFVSRGVMFTWTYYFVYLNVLQEMKREGFLHQASLLFSVLFPKENKILFKL